MKNYKKITAFMVTGITMMMTVLSPMSVYADRVDEKPYIFIGRRLDYRPKSNCIGINGCKGKRISRLYS